MNSKSVMMIVAIGGIGLLGLIVAAMMGFGKLAEQPFVRAALEVADRHNVREVNLRLVPPKGPTRTLRVAYETSVFYPTLDAEGEEMDAVAKFALERVEKAEKEKVLLPSERAGLGPVNKVEVRRTWRSERGCFKRSSESTHEWIPPPPPPKLK
jgi:hypothetical protein